MKMFKRMRRGRTVGALFAAGIVCQLGGCDFGQITVTQTVDSRELLIGLVRGAILGPIDEYITNAINEAFDESD